VLKNYHVWLRYELFPRLDQHCGARLERKASRRLRYDP
jgi:hypothetical protein